MHKPLSQLAAIAPAERILLLPHCLRRTETCRATYDQQGLKCAKCDPDCSINILSEVAARCGYKGVCVAPGGRLAVRFVKETKPAAIVAVACDKELEEGVLEVNSLAEQDIAPLIFIVPLLKDGCVDTEVDNEKALEVITLGCRIEVAQKAG